MIDLYYWPTPNGWKVSIALEEMGLPYQTHLVDIGAGAQFAPNFLAISPNNRMPAIVDPEGPDGAPVSVFESGAILQYLARKTGRFHGTTERARIAVEEWLFWQVGGLGPMAGQAHHFLKYAPNMNPPNDLPYAKDRYRSEVARLSGVMDRELAAGGAAGAGAGGGPAGRSGAGSQGPVGSVPHLNGPKPVRPKPVPPGGRWANQACGGGLSSFWSLSFPAAVSMP